MAYKFYSKLDVILKIMFSELERNALEVDAMEKALAEMDKLKVKTKSPIKFSADLWKLASPNYKKGNTAIDAVLRLENAYILAEQYWIFLRATAQETNKLNTQLYIMSKMQNSEHISEDLLNQNLNLPVNDCNELYRYINIWDMNRFLIPKYKSCVGIYQHVVDEFKEPLMRFKVHEMGLNNYVENLKMAYAKKIDDINNLYGTTKQKFDDLGKNIVQINKQVNYKHYCPLNYSDGSRAPLGGETIYNFKELYDDALKNYTKKCENEKKNIEK